MSTAWRAVFVICQDRGVSLDFYRHLGFALCRQSSRSSVLSLPHGPELHLHDPLSAEEEREYGMSWQAGGRGLIMSLTTEDLDGLLQSVPPESLRVAPRRSPWGTRLAIVADPDGYLWELQSEVPP